MYFPFNCLPAEVKRSIWELALPGLEPEFCTAWPQKQTEPDQAVTPMLVDTAFPVLMHVCQEWRAYVLGSAATSSATASSRGSSRAFPVRFRYARSAGCLVACRDFRPELDTLYTSPTDLKRIRRWGRGRAGARDAAGGHKPDIERATLSRVRHLAVEWMPADELAGAVCALVFRQRLDLRHVTVVYSFHERPLVRRHVLRGIGEHKGDGGSWLPWIEDDDVDEGHVARRLRQSLVAQVKWARTLAQGMSQKIWDAKCSKFNGATDWYTGFGWDKERSCLRVTFQVSCLYILRTLEDRRQAWQIDQTEVVGEYYERRPKPALHARG